MYISFSFSFTLAATTAGDLAFNERNTTWLAIRGGERKRGVLRVDYGGDLEVCPPLSLYISWSFVGVVKIFG